MAKKNNYVMVGGINFSALTITIKDAKINGPIAMVSDDRNNLYVSNYNGIM